MSRVTEALAGVDPRIKREIFMPLTLSICIKVYPLPEGTARLGDAYTENIIVIKLSELRFQVDLLLVQQKREKFIND
jgi:hypothetical protein